MKKCLDFIFFLTLTFWSLSSCTTAVRYSPEELKDYPPDVQDQIRQGNVSVGMTIQQVRYAWGAPSTVHVLTPTIEGKLREEWIYSSGILMQRRLLFVDGTLFDIFPAPKVQQQPMPQDQQLQPQQQEPQQLQPEEKK